MKDLASKLRKLITIESPFKINNEDSMFEQEWKPIYQLRASIVAINEYRYQGNVVWHAAQAMTHSYYLFTIRFKDNLNINMRISYQGRNFNIERIVNIEERDVAMHLIAKEDNL